MSFHLQNQIKNNATDIKDFIDDLYKWEDKAMKNDKKDINVEKISFQNPNNEVNEGNSEIPKSKYARDGTDMQTYYKAWDQFDVEEELSKIEDDPNAPKKLDILKPKVMSDANKNSKIEIKGGRTSLPNLNSLKEKANLEFNNSEFEKAIKIYEEIISSYSFFKSEFEEFPIENDGKSTIFSNKAMALIKLGKYKEAESDCLEAIKLNPRNPKALYRLGTIKLKFKFLEESKIYFEAVLKIDKDNTFCKNEIAKIDAVIKSRINDAHDKLITSYEELSAEEFMRLKVKDIFIVENDNEFKEICKENKEEKESKFIQINEISEQKENNQNSPKDNSLLSYDFIKLKNIEKSISHHNTDINSHNNDDMKRRVSFGGVVEGKLLSNGIKRRKSILKTHLNENQGKSNKIVNQFHHEEMIKNKEEKAIELSIENSKKRITLNNEYNSSKNLIQDLRLSAKDNLLMKILIKNINPSTIPNLFQEGIEPDILILLINGLNQQINDIPYEHSLNILYQICKTKRFSFIIKTLDSTEKKS